MPVAIVLPTQAGVASGRGDGAVTFGTQKGYAAAPAHRRPHR